MICSPPLIVVPVWISLFSRLGRGLGQANFAMGLIPLPGK